MLPLPPDVMSPTGPSSALSAALPCMRSRVIAMISPSNRVALGHMSRWSTFMWLYMPNTSFMKS